MEISTKIKSIGSILLLIIWLGSVSLVLLSSAWLRVLIAILLALFLLQSLVRMRRETLFVVTFIGLLTLSLLATGANVNGLLQGLERTLVFAALLPTLQLTRATARRLPVVIESQQRFTRLPERWADVGILFGSQAFGSILNTGAFAIMSAVVPEQTNPENRRSAATASLRGMNIAALWSPFFVGFAVATTYLPTVHLWQLMLLGLTLVSCGLTMALLLFARPLTLNAVEAALNCLHPIFLPIGLSAGAIILVSLLTPISTLGALLLIMPLLCMLQTCRQPATLRAIIDETHRGMSRMGDDLLIITMAMILGTVTETSPLIEQYLIPLLTDWLPSAFSIAVVILVMLIGGVIGLHPMITGTVLLVSFTQSPYPLSDLVLMEAMLTGWALSSITSISSLSLVTAGAMYRTPPLGLVFSHNLLFAGLFAVFTSIVLTMLNVLLI